MALLPVLDEDPDEWAPDLCEMGEVLPEVVLKLIIAEGNHQGEVIDPDDDDDNGLRPR